MGDERVVPESLVRRAFGSPSVPGGCGTVLHRAGFNRLALAELRRAVHHRPQEPVGWTALLDYFLAENLALSALATVRELDARGFSVSVPGPVRERLGRFKAVPPIALYVPAFNAAGSLALVLESVRAQSLRPAHVMVVDDGSTDATAQVAARFAEVELLRHGDNRGLAAARNTALAATRHPLLASLDSDVIAGEFWLERLVVAMLEAPLVGAFGALVERNAVRLPDRWRARVMALLYPGQGDIDDAVLYGSNTLFTTAALRAVGGHDPQYTKAFDDTDLGNRLRAAGLHIRYIHRAVCEHTRRDTLQSVLRSCYSYRKPRALKEKMFDRIETLELRWNTLFRDGITELEELARTGSVSVAFPSLLNIFWTIAEDLKEFLRVGGDDARRRYAGAALGALDRAVGEIPGLSASGMAAIRAALQPARDELLNGVASMAVDDPVVEELYVRCFAKAGVVLHFSPVVRAAFEQGAAESLLREGVGGADDERLAVVECGYLLGDGECGGVTGALDQGIIARWREGGIAIATFERTTPLLDPQQRGAALKGYRPTQVILIATGEGMERVARGYLRLLDWCEGNPRVTIVGTTTRFDELPEVEFTAEEPRHVLEKILGNTSPDRVALTQDPRL